jgi:hypothetical protein
VLEYSLEACVSRAVQHGLAQTVLNSAAQCRKSLHNQSRVEHNRTMFVRLTLHNARAFSYYALPGLTNNERSLSGEDLSWMVLKVDFICRISMIVFAACVLECVLSQPVSFKSTRARCAKNKIALLAAFCVSGTEASGVLRRSAGVRDG